MIYVFRRGRRSSAGGGESPQPSGPSNSPKRALCKLLDASSKPGGAVDHVLETSAERERLPQLCGQCFEMLFHESCAAWAGEAASVASGTCPPMPGSGALSRFRSAQALALLLELLPLLPTELACHYLATLQGLLDRSVANVEFAVRLGTRARRTLAPARPAPTSTGWAPATSRRTNTCSDSRGSAGDFWILVSRLVCTFGVCWCSAVHYYILIVNAPAGSATAHKQPAHRQRACALRVG